MIFNSGHKINFLNPIFMKQIERENICIYSKLIQVYTRKASQFERCSRSEAHHNRQQSEFKKSQCLKRIRLMRKIQEENIHTLVRLLQVKPSEDLSIKLLKKFWQSQMDYKKRMCLSKKALVNASF